MKLAMLNFNIASLVLSLSSALFSCAEPIDASFLGNAEEIAVECYISPSDSLISAAVMRSTSFSQSITPIDSLFIENAKVLISNNIEEIQLKYNLKSHSYEYPSADFKIETGKNYKLKVIVGDKILSSECTVPTRTITPIEINILKFYRTPDVVDVKLKWKKERNENYIINGYYFLTLGEVTRHQSFPEQYFKSTEIPSDSLQSNFFTNDLLYFNNRRNRFLFKIADENLYNYFKSVKLNIDGQSDPFSQPTNAISNIHGGGKGCFGAYTLTILDYEL